MNITKEEFAAQFEKLSDNEVLRRVRSGTMTPLAFEAACEELDARGVEFKSPDESVEAQEDAKVDTLVEQDHAGFDFVTIAHLVNPLRANLLRSHLQSEGIVVHLLGEQLGVVDILWSAGTGGIRVQVRNDYVDRALVILAEFDRIQQTVGETSDESDEQLQLPEGGEGKRYSPERDSLYAPPKSHVADVQQAKARRESLNKPSTPLFFWIFTLIAIGAAFYVLASS